MSEEEEYIKGFVNSRLREDLCEQIEQETKTTFLEKQIFILEQRISVLEESDKN